MDQSISQAVKQSSDQSSTQLVDQPIKWSAGYSTNKSADTSVEQVICNAFIILDTIMPMITEDSDCFCATLQDAASLAVDSSLRNFAVEQNQIFSCFLSQFFIFYFYYF